MHLRDTLRRIGRGLRTAWVALGTVLLILLCLELAYRAQGSLRRSMEGTIDDASGLSREFRKEASSEGRLGWRPYVYYRRLPEQGTWVNVDSASHRRTVPAPPPGAHRQVFVFGASPVWGATLADSMTIPSRLAHALAAQGLADVEVVNLGETGYVFTQEAIELLLQLRQGARPAAVVFYNGFNDVASTLQNGFNGVTKSESDRARDYALGARLYSWHPDIGTDLRVARTLAGIAASRVQLVSRFRPAPRTANTRPDEAIADSVIRNYTGTMGIVEALATHYGFAAYYAWMPLLDSSAKTLSARERALFDASQQFDENQRFLNVYRQARRRVAAPASQVAPGRFADYAQLFAADSATEFVDDQGHTSGSGSEAVAQAMARLIAPGLKAEACAGTPPRAGACLGGRR